MNIVRYAGPDGVRVGVGDGAAVRPLAVAAVAELLAMPADRMTGSLYKTVLSSCNGSIASRPRYAIPMASGCLPLWFRAISWQIRRSNFCSPVPT